MAKEAIKDRAAERQNGQSITGASLPKDVDGELLHPLTDTHRRTPKADGGTYTDENTTVMLPTEHRDLHGNTPWLDDAGLIELRAIMEDYRTCQRLRMKINNHKLAVQRGMDEITPDIDDMFRDTLEVVSEKEAQFKKLAEKQLKNIEHPMIEIVHNIRGIGPIYVAELITLINIEKAQYPSSLWSFVGYDGPSKDRYVKGRKGGGHKHLRSVLYCVGGNFLKNGNDAYTEIYYRRKEKTSNSKKTVQHKDTRSSNWQEVAWKDVNPGRRHHDALRVMMKHFLADLWFVWRDVVGLPTEDLYVKEHLGHTGIISPRERGWEW